MQYLSTVCIAALLLISTAGVAPVAADGHDATYERCEFPITVTDATGEEITLEEPPDRVTTTNPSAAQLMWELNASDQVVGVTQFASYLTGADTKPDISADFGVSVERVAATEPDLVLAPNASAGQVEGLRSAGLTVYHYEAATEIDDIREQTRITGKLTDNCKQAAGTNAWMDANVAAVSEVVAGVDDEPRVLYSLGGQNGEDPFVVGGNTFITRMLTVAGSENIAAEEADGYPQLSREVILKLDPEYLIVTGDAKAIIEKEPYAGTTAGREENTVQLDVNFLNQPAPRSVVVTIHNATEQLHPTLYSSDAYVPRSDITVIAETQAREYRESEPPTPTTPSTDSPDIDDATPGFGAGAALIAVLVATLAVIRRQ